MTVLITCPGLHLARPTPGWQLITWNPMIDYVDRVRVVTATCGTCGTDTYELCSGGGLMWIRRLRRDGRTCVISDSDRWRAPDAWDAWRLLLAGRLR